MNKVNLVLTTRHKGKKASYRFLLEGFNDNEITFNGVYSFIQETKDTLRLVKGFSIKALFTLNVETLRYKPLDIYVSYFRVIHVRSERLKGSPRTVAIYGEADFEGTPNVAIWSHVLVYSHTKTREFHNNWVSPSEDEQDSNH